MSFDKIVGVAFLLPSGLLCTLPAPNRHHNLIRCLTEHGCKTPVTKNVTQGFVLDNGMFIGREDARKLAEKNGQLLETAGDHDILFSEDVW